MGMSLKYACSHVAGYMQLEGEDGVMQKSKQQKRGNHRMLQMCVILEAICDWEVVCLSKGTMIQRRYVV